MESESENKFYEIVLITVGLLIRALVSTTTSGPQSNISQDWLDIQYCIELTIVVSDRLHSPMVTTIRPLGFGPVSPQSFNALNQWMDVVHLRIFISLLPQNFLRLAWLDLLN